MDTGFEYKINVGGDFDPELNKFSKHLNDLTQQLGKFDQTINTVFSEVQKQASQANDSIRRISFQSISEGIQQFGQVLGEVGKPGLVFEQQMADLSAITGIADKELETLGVTAKEVGAATGLGAAQAAEAFKLLASNINIEKLGGIEGLKNLQKETITLAQAAGVDLPTAADTMAAAINQFGLEGTDASRVINVLAAGAKYGAAEIPHLADSLKKVGSVAGAFKVSLEETTGALEILSQSGIKSELAGTGLASIITRMKTMLGVDFSKMSLTDALVQLKPKLQDADFLMKTFGQDNIDVAAVLIKNAESVGDMTNAVTGTNVATEQAAIRTATYQNKLDRIKASIENFKIGLSEATGSLMPMMGLMGEWLVTLGQIAPAVMLVKDAVIAWNAWEGVLNLQLLGTQIALDALGIGLIIAGVVALAAGVKYCWDHFEGFREVVLGVGTVLWNSLILPFKIIYNLLKAVFTLSFDPIKDIGKDMITALDVVSGYKSGAEMGKESWKNDQKKSNTSAQGVAGISSNTKKAQGPVIDFSGKSKGKSNGEGLINTTAASGITSGKASTNNIRFESVIKQVIINITKETEDIGKRVKDEVARAAMAGMEDVMISKFQNG